MSEPVLFELNYTARIVISDLQVFSESRRSQPIMELERMIDMATPAEKGEGVWPAELDDTIRRTTRSVAEFCVENAWLPSSATKLCLAGKEACGDKQVY